MRISIVALNALPAIEPSAGRGIGGLETFAWRLARGMARTKSNSVQFVVRATSPRPSCVVEQVQIDSFSEPLRQLRQSVSRALEFKDGARLPRLKKWNASLVWQIPTLALNKLLRPQFSEQKAMQDAIVSFRPDLILTLGVNRTSAQLGEIAAALNIPIVVWLQSNADLDERFFSDDSFVDRYGVHSIDARNCWCRCKNVICQTQTQQERLHRLQEDAGGTLRSLQSTVIVNPIDSIGTLDVLPKFRDRRGVLWIGRADQFHKRPRFALEIAAMCPDVPFTMIVNPGDEVIHAEIRTRAGANVALFDYLPPEQVRMQLSQAKLFLSTGSATYEGFPNVLLEACASGTPIITLEDFDGFLQRSNAGFCSLGDVRLAAEAVLRLSGDANLWDRHSMSGFEYVQSNHHIDHVVEQFALWSQACIESKF